MTILAKKYIKSEKEEKNNKLGVCNINRYTQYNPDLYGVPNITRQLMARTKYMRFVYNYIGK